jgi:hypothetical protein
MGFNFGNPDQPLFEIVGSHTYLDPPGQYSGQYSVTIDVVYKNDSPVQVRGAVNVSVSPLTGFNGTTVGIAGSPISTQQYANSPTPTPVQGGAILGTFIDVNMSTDPSDYDAYVLWGDNSSIQHASDNDPQNFIFPEGNSGSYSVYGAHTYKKPGVYPITIFVQSINGTSTFILSSAVISDASLTTSSKQPCVISYEDNLVEVEIGSFCSTDPLANPCEFQASIDWNDGTPLVAGKIKQHKANGPFTVYGIHKYGSNGCRSNDCRISGCCGTNNYCETNSSYDIQIFIVSNGGTRIIINNKVTVKKYGTRYNS